MAVRYGTIAVEQAEFVLRAYDQLYVFIDGCATFCTIARRVWYHEIAIGQVRWVRILSDTISVKREIHMVPLIYIYNN